MLLSVSKTCLGLLWVNGFFLLQLLLLLAATKCTLASYSVQQEPRHSLQQNTESDFKLVSGDLIIRDTPLKEEVFGRISLVKSGDFHLASAWFQLYFDKYQKMAGGKVCLDFATLSIGNFDYSLLEWCFQVEMGFGYISIEKNSKILGFLMNSEKWQADVFDMLDLLRVKMLE